MDKIYGDEIAPIVKGFLINDKEDIPASVQTDFKRSGTSHLLAVSGLHIALLLGSLDILQKRLFVPKKIRCITVAVAAIALLALTNFSASAVRSVFMLYAVYLSFLFYEDHDTVTALFVSVGIIILISPFSVYDIGMWMSFLATLGLVTVYVYFDGRLKGIRSTKKFLKLPLAFGLCVTRVVLLTLVANFFLIPIMCFFFGEISLAAIPANLLLSPIMAVFMPLCAIGVILGGIPVLNVPIVQLTGLFQKLILYITDSFANMRGAVLSLKYPFVPVLVVLFSLALAVMLIIRLKRKMLIALPPLLFAVSFCICFGVFSYTEKPEVRYCSYKNNDIIFFDSVGKSTVCDVTSGGYAARSVLYDNLNEYATEIENYIITHVHKYHSESMQRILSSIYVRNIYIPLRDHPDDILYSDDLRRVAEEYGARVIFYKSGDAIRLFDEMTLHSHFEGDKGHPKVFVTLTDGECRFTYTDAAECSNGAIIGANSAYFVVGGHGYRNDESTGGVSVSADTRVIFTSQEGFENTRIACTQSQGYIIKGENLKKKMILPLR